MQEVIKVRQLTKSYHNLPAADNVSFSVNKGMVFGRMYLRHKESRQGRDLRFGNESTDRPEKAV